MPSTFYFLPLNVTVYISVQVRELGVEVDVRAQELMVLMARALTAAASRGHHPWAAAQLPGIQERAATCTFSAAFLKKRLRATWGALLSQV